MQIAKIISGGQTGADRGGLEAALYCQVPHGGWCPKARKAEDGPIPDKYKLSEMMTAGYLARTEANVADSDATLVFTKGKATGGSARTVEFCLKHKRPWHHIDITLDLREGAVNQIVAWLDGDIAFEYPGYTARPPRNCVLNIAGSRESKSKGIADTVEKIMVDVFIRTNPECKSYYPLT